MIENRKFIRLKSPLPVEYKILRKHKRQKTQDSYMKNISVGGLSLCVVEDVRHGELLQLDIRIPHFEDPVRVVGDVVWFTATKNRDSGEIDRYAGIRFKQVDPRELNKILDFVYSIAIG